MNCRHFGCQRCKTYIDAGYRWAYWLLDEPGIVALGQPISIEAVLSAMGYWNPSAEERNGWLDEILARARTFLEAHRRHGIIYFEDDMICDPDGPCADWVEEKDASPAAPPD